MCPLVALDNWTLAVETMPRRTGFVPYHVVTYIEFAMFFRQVLTNRQLAIPQAHRLCEGKIPMTNFYKWVRGERVPCSWQLKMLETRMNFTTPYKMLMGVDSFGERKKPSQIGFPFEANR